jgi:predicted outer membrane repeat protein
MFLLSLSLALAGAMAQPTLAACPGTSTCKSNNGCPQGSVIISNGQSIQNAINAAGCSATICVRPGTYTGLIDFKGKKINLVSSNGPGVTILNGAGLGPVVSFKTAEGPASILDGFQVVNGKNPTGGGIFIQNASPVIRNCIIQRNVAAATSTNSFPRGGGVWVGGASAKPAITCTRFVGNHADYAGGGLLTGGFADPYLRFDQFQGNTASFGGGIAAYSSGRLDVGTTMFLNNQATGDGGGIHAGVVYGNVLVRQCWFKTNKAGGSGGGMWVPAGLAQVINSTFDGNQASTGGGIAAGDGGMVDVASTIFANNTGTALVNTQPVGSNTSVVNHYNDFFNNSGGTFVDTYGDLGLLLVDPQLNACCPVAGSPVINAGIPDSLFNDINGTRNDMGACGGPAI